MAINALQLPVDIPWIRLCLSEDMLDPRVCDRIFPFKWRSSVVVFSYEPPSDSQAYKGMIVSYLKVVCSITGFQPDPDEAGITTHQFATSWDDPVVIQNYLAVINEYYGCYGAILQVALAPAGEKVNAPDDAYFIDFEPKKRELYELVSESGEVMSRSLEAVNVRKGTTTTGSHEVLDVFGGAGAQYAGASASVQGQWGTKDVSQQEYTNIRTTDQAREARETYSHTTQLTQMYHQLDSYHLGTNRAVFFVLPRPHVVQSDMTFVNGPRVLEGIQEFFLAIMRPANTKAPCVEAYLETAHIASTPLFEYVTGTATLTLNVTKNAVDTSGGFGSDSNTTYAESSETYTPPAGWEVDVNRDGGIHIESISGDRIESATVSSVAADHVTIFGKVNAWFEDRSWPEDNVSHNGSLVMTVTVYIRNKTPKIAGYQQDLFVTGRGVCCCEKLKVHIGDSVVFETAFDRKVAAPIGKNERLSVGEANRVRAAISHELRRSLNSVDRHARGFVGFAESQVVGGLLSSLIRKDGHPDNETIGEISNVPPSIREKVVHIAPRISRGRLLSMPLQEQMDRFSLTPEEALLLRRAALGLAGKPPAPSEAYQPPRSIPDVKGKTLLDAETLIARAGVRLGSTQIIDNPRSAQTVIGQFPTPGTRAGAGISVDLVLASGTIVLPDVVGLEVKQAISVMRRAGLLSDPVIVSRAGSPIVLAITPPSGTRITPHGGVALEVGVAP
jgi:hypothetical protein